MESKTLPEPLTQLAQRLGVALTPRGRHDRLVTEAAERAGLDLAQFSQFGVGEVVTLLHALAGVINPMAGRVRWERQLHNTRGTLDAIDVPVAAGSAPAAAALAVGLWSHQIATGVCRCGAALSAGSAGHQVGCPVVADVADLCRWLLDAS